MPPRWRASLASMRALLMRILTAFVALCAVPALAEDELAAVDGPVVLAGDMNAERRQVCSILEPAGYTVAMTAPTFPADRPRRTIDGVAARGVAIAEVRVPVTTASDHRPIVVDLELSSAHSG